MSIAGRFPVRTEIINKHDYESDENGDFFGSVTFMDGKKCYNVDQQYYHVAVRTNGDLHFDFFQAPFQPIENISGNHFDGGEESDEKQMYSRPDQTIYTGIGVLIAR